MSSRKKLANFCPADLLLDQAKVAHPTTAYMPPWKQPAADLHSRHTTGAGLEHRVDRKRRSQATAAPTHPAGRRLAAAPSPC